MNPGHRRNGTSWLAELSRSGRGFNYFGNITARSPDFRSELGYIPRVDMRQLFQETGYSWHPEKSRVLRFGPDLEASALWDYGGQLQDWQLEPGFEIEFPGQTEVGVHGSRGVRAVRGHRVPQRRRNGSRQHRVAVVARRQRAPTPAGRGINYYPAERLEPFLGTEQSVETGFTLRPLSRLRLDLSYLYQQPLHE